MAPGGGSSTLGAKDIAKIKKHLSKLKAARKAEKAQLKAQQQKIEIEDQSADSSQAAIISASSVSNPDA